MGSRKQRDFVKTCKTHNAMFDSCTYPDIFSQGKGGGLYYLNIQTLYIYNIWIEILHYIDEYTNLPGLGDTGSGINGSKLKKRKNQK